MAFENYLGVKYTPEGSDKTYEWPDFVAIARGDERYAAVLVCRCLDDDLAWNYPEEVFNYDLEAGYIAIDDGKVVVEAFDDYWLGKFCDLARAEGFSVNGCDEVLAFCKKAPNGISPCLPALVYDSPLTPLGIHNQLEKCIETYSLDEVMSNHEFGGYHPGAKDVLEAEEWGLSQQNVLLELSTSLVMEQAQRAMAGKLPVPGKKAERMMTPEEIVAAAKKSCAASAKKVTGGVTELRHV